jgi:hypothetical protein
MLSAYCVTGLCREALQRQGSTSLARMMPREFVYPTKQSTAAAQEKLERWKKWKKLLMQMGT